MAARLLCADAVLLSWRATPTYVILRWIVFAGAGLYPPAAGRRFPPGRGRYEVSPRIFRPWAARPQSKASLERRFLSSPILSFARKRKNGKTNRFPPIAPSGHFPLGGKWRAKRGKRGIFFLFSIFLVLEYDFRARSFLEISRPNRARRGAFRRK